MAFIGFGIVIVGVGLVVLLVSDVLFGAAIIGIGSAGIAFGIYMLASTGRMRARSATSGQDYDGQDDADG